MWSRRTKAEGEVYWLNKGDGSVMDENPRASEGAEGVCDDGPEAWPSDDVEELDEEERAEGWL